MKYTEKVSRKIWLQEGQEKTDRSNVLLSTAWAICDTDGGRQEPKPLIRHIYETEKIARDTADYCGFDSQWYPVHKINIVLSR